MKNLVLFVGLMFVVNFSFGQVKTQKKVILNQKTFAQKIPVTREKPKLIHGNYTIVEYYELTKKSLKKKQVEVLLDSKINFSEVAITGEFIDSIGVEVYEIEQMNKSDYLFRVFNELIETNIIEFTDTLTVHKIENSIFLGFIELPNHKIAFPYKGGLVIAQLIE